MGWNEVCASILFLSTCLCFPVQEIVVVEAAARKTGCCPAIVSCAKTLLTLSWLIAGAVLCGWLQLPHSAHQQ